MVSLLRRIPTTWSGSSGCCWTETELQWRPWWRSSSVPIATRWRRTIADWYRSSRTAWEHPDFQQQRNVSCVVLVAVGGSGERRRERSGNPGDHEEVLGGEPVPVVSSYSRGSLASLPQCSQARHQQVRGAPSIKKIFISFPFPWVFYLFLSLNICFYWLCLGHGFCSMILNVLYY